MLKKWLFNRIKKSLPTITETEIKALAAGDVGFEKELFSGVPDWSKLLLLPKPTLSADEQHFLDNQVNHLCSLLHDGDSDSAFHQDLSESVWKYLKKERFFGLIISKKYGGLEFSALGHSTVITKIASRNYSAAVSVMVPNSLGPAEFIQHYGTEHQKKYYLPRLAMGDEIPCFALTAPTAGSDAASITDSGVVIEGEFEGKKVLGLELNWNKRYITLAPIATLLGIAVKVSDPHHLLSQQVKRGITLCLVPTHLKGVEIGLRHHPLSLSFLNGPTKGHNVFIPLDYIIGGQENIGKGWEMMMASLAVGRGISLPAVSAGTSKLLYRTTGAYAKVRHQFKCSIGEFEGIKEALARIGGITYLVESTRIFAATAIDSGQKSAIASAIAKYHITENTRQLVNDAMDIHGGRGIMLGARNYTAAAYASIPVGITVEGANILTRNLIIFGQGLIRCHPYLSQEMAAVQDKDKKRGMKDFQTIIFSHLGYFLKTFLRALWHHLSGGKWIRVSRNDFLRSYLQKLTRMSTALAFVSEVSVLLIGGEFKRREQLSARLGDVLSQLYLASAVIQYYHNQEERPEDRPYVEWCLQTCLAKCHEAFQAFFSNFPRPVFGRAMKASLFLFGGRYQRPLDRLSHEIANHMMKESVLRDRLLQYSYVDKDLKDAVHQMEMAFKEALAVDSIHAKLKAVSHTDPIWSTLDREQTLAHAIKEGILSEAEVSLVRAARSSEEEAIQVDAYTE